jgi:hypothetical protein
VKGRIYKEGHRWQETVMTGESLTKEPFATIQAGLKETCKGT